MKNSNLFIGLIAGAAIGATLGVLFAQKKGKKTRKHIAKSINEFTGNLSKETESILSGLKEKFGKKEQSV